MQFVKMEGLGNDFVVVDGPRDISTEQIGAWCDRRRGIGADGVLEVSGAEAAGGADVRMRYWNADGSVAEMCGNGLRCVARYAHDRGMVEGPEFVIATAVGRNRAQVLDDGRVRVQLGPFEVGDLVDVDGRAFRCASVGNPHAVTFVDEAPTELVHSLGPRVETDGQFAEGANVEFVTVHDGHLSLRVWERGVGETLACGTGAAAAAAVAMADGAAGSTVTVELLGGPLDVDLVDDQAWITGPANYVFRGEVD